MKRTTEMSAPSAATGGSEGQRTRQQELEKKLLCAIDRGDFREATPAFWENLRDRAVAANQEKQRMSIGEPSATAVPRED